MLINDSDVLDKLQKMILRMTHNPAMRADLMQEALIRLWQIQNQEPAQSRAWYIQNCRFHLLHYLALGRSVDSPKRQGARVHPSYEDDQGYEWMDQFEGESTVLQEVNVRDILALLSKTLSPRETCILHWLTEGLGTREIARQLNISHAMVVKHRRNIAAMAAKLSVDHRISLP
jgi:RNA polymerase sigma factor (sigma-70 family)